MTKLAILGHETRGKEVIEILEMLGGKLSRQLSGGASSSGYYIKADGNIDYNFSSCFDDDVIQFTIEEFLEKYPYKIGDKVIWKLDKDKTRRTIARVSWGGSRGVVYWLNCKGSSFGWCDVNELEPYKEETMKNKLEQITLDIPNGYEFFGIDDDNKIVLTKKQSQYPKTYEECCDILEYPHNIVGGYKAELLSNFQNLLICRDVYWKIAGWNPKIKGEKFYMNSLPSYLRDVFPMPTEEMRDAFSENFEDLIEDCKEL